LKLLVNENIQRQVVEALRQAGWDILWAAEVSPRAEDLDILGRARGEGRVILTFDKDYGEYLFRLGVAAPPGIILARLRLRSPDAVARALQTALSRDLPWEVHFSVITEVRVRMTPIQR